MSVSNGQAANAATFNGAFVSKTADSSTNGVLTQEKESVLKEIATPSTPGSGYGKIYFKADGKLYQLNDSGIENQVGSGAGGGVVNFIANGGAEDNNTVGWAVYADAAGTSPVDGTGGTGNVTISATATTPLIGTYSFLMAKDAVNRQGQGWSYAFTIDSAYKAKVLQIDFEYQIESGTFAAGTSSADSDVTVWIYDVTNGVLIQPSAYKLLSNSSTLSTRHSATFQSASNSTSYRLIFHVGSTSASAYTLEVDGISVAPEQYIYGTPVTDWASYTPTFQGFGTPTSVEIQWRRVGDSLQAKGKFTTGTTTAVEARIGLPSGLTSADTSKIQSIQICGELRRNLATAANGFNVLAEPSVTYVTLGQFTNASAALTKATGSGGFGSSEVQTFYFQIPISGWSSSVQTSDQTDTRVVGFNGSIGAVAYTANTTNITATSVRDTHAAWNGSQYVAPAPGDYIAMFTTIANTTNGFGYMFVNGTAVSGYGSYQATANQAGSGTQYLPNIKTGDLISLRIGGSNGTTVSGGAISIFRISGPSAIAASETVTASYFVSAGASTADTVQFNFDTKSWDSHNAVSTGAGVWKFSAPISGIYFVSATLYLGGTNSNAAVYKNGSIFRSLAGPFGAAATNMTAPGSTLIQLNAGDYIDIRNVSGAARTPSATAFTGATIATCNFVNISRVGN